MTIKAALSDAKKILSDANIDSAALDAEILLSHILYTGRSQLVLLFDNTIDDKTLTIFKKYIKRRMNGVCTACITGHKEFRYLDFFVNRRVLVPRPETESLVEAALQCIDRARNETHGMQSITVLDLCTGSGAIALSLWYERPGIDVSACDISAPALGIAKKNYHRFLKGVGTDSGNVDVYKNNSRPVPRFIQSDLFKNIAGQFDIIVSNPPYIAREKIKTLSREVQNEPRLALDGGADGLDFIKKIIIGAQKHLYPAGTLLLEAAPEQMPIISELLTKTGYKNNTIKKDLAGADRVITAAP
jgi:release factor glutamine methyltransferase